MLAKYGADFWMTFIDKLIVQLKHEVVLVPFFSGISEQKMLAMKLGIIELLIEGSPMEDSTFLWEAHKNLGITEGCYRRFLQIAQMSLAQSDVDASDIQTICERAQDLSSHIISD